MIIEREELKGEKGERVYKKLKKNKELRLYQAVFEAQSFVLTP